MKTIRFQQLLLAVMPLLLIASAFAFPLAARAEPSLAPAERPRQAETLSLYIGTSEDDVSQISGVVDLYGDSLMLGDDGLASSHVGLRFADITIPQGATIESANLMVQYSAASEGSPALMIRGHAVADSPTFAPGDGPLNRLDQGTIAFVNWSAPDSGANTLASTPDLSSIIQEIVARPDWTSGNALSLMIYDDFLFADGQNTQVWSWDAPDSSAPHLSISYSTAPQVADYINTNLYTTDEFVALISPDLVITRMETNQAGYPLFDTYTIEVDVTNMGGSDTGPFEVIGQIGRHHNGQAAITWGLGDCSTAIDPSYGCELAENAYFSFGTVQNLAAGETAVLDSGLRSLATDVFEDDGPSLWNGPPWPYLANIPRWGQVFLKAEALPLENELSTSNNASVTSFMYPNNPASFSSFYIPSQDGDGDGYYVPLYGDDCNDDDPRIHPDAWEIPGNGIDENCDNLDQWGDIEAIPGWDPWCAVGSPSESDVDNDNWSVDDGDCNPCDALIYPEATEILNALDDDCDGEVDEGFTPWGKTGDADGDGWANDCDETQGWINPGANELPDGIDNDCDGFVDEGFLTPDWVISSFSLYRVDDDCIYHPNQNLIMGPDPMPLCGIQAEFDVANLGDVLGDSEIPFIRNQVRLLDLSGQEYPTFAPYYAFPGQAYAEYMACDNAGLIASVPGGILGEENTSNNWSIFDLTAIDRDLDIAHTDIHLYYAEPRLPTLERDLLRITGFGGTQGSCPPPTFFYNYSIQVKVFVEGEQAFVGNYVEQQVPPHNVLPIIENGLRLTFPNRPGNNDAVRIEILLNGDERFDEDPGNNLCVINLSYDRNNPPIGAIFDPDVSFSTNDELVFVSKEGACEDIWVHSGSSVTVGLTGASSIHIVFFLGLVVLLGTGLAGGWLLGRNLVQRLGVAGAGRVVSSIAGALIGGTVLVGAAIGVATIAGSPDADLASPPRILEAGSEDLTGLLTGDDDPQLAYCEDLVPSSMEAVMSNAGELEDVVLNLQAVEGTDLPVDSSFRVTLWDGDGSPLAVLTTEETALSLASENLLPEMGERLFWQVVVETQGTDTLTCLPMIQAFVVGAVTEDAEIDLPDEPGGIITPAPPDTAPPSVKSTSAVPNPTLTTVPVTISANISDQTGIAGADLYYQVGKGAVQYGGAMLHYGGGVYSIQIGPLVPAGTYDYYILAEDTLSNATCTLATIETCPGGTFVVNIP